MRFFNPVPPQLQSSPKSPPVALGRSDSVEIAAFPDF
jgi:hypothetical protein